MSRPVKNARHGKTPKNPGPDNATKPMTKFGGMTSSKYGTTPIGPNIERASQPRFLGPTQVLNRYDGH